MTIWPILMYVVPSIICMLIATHKGYKIGWAGLWGFTLNYIGVFIYMFLKSKPKSIAKDANPNATRSILISGFISICFGIFMCLAVSLTDSPNPFSLDRSNTHKRVDRVEAQSEIDLPSKSNAYTMSQAYVEAVLRSPSTADFPYHQGHVSQNNELYVIRSYVDSQNGFGAMVRSEYVMTLEYIGPDWSKGSSWNILLFSFDGESII